MRIVITAATAGEWMPAFSNINTGYKEQAAPVSVSFHTSGVGLLASAVALTKLVLEEKPGLVIQAGIAGCFDNDAVLGGVFVIAEEMLGDTGVEENGHWIDLFDLKLQQPDNPPFTDKVLPNPWLQKFNLLLLPTARGITVNEITASTHRREQLIKKYNPFVESMEGAALHYTCLQQGIPFLQVRAISNYIGERDKSKWKMKDAIVNLNEALLDLIEAVKSET